jgi:hypothetical protein
VKWFKEITKDYENLKDLHNQNSQLNDKWNICKEKCDSCYFTCSLLKGHPEKHDCLCDHKCKEKCLICKEINKDNNDVNNINQCSKQSGHPDNHSCDKFHSCSGICVYHPYSNDCKDCNGKCSLDYPHKGQAHNCGASKHHCKEKCYLNGKARCCGENCNSENLLEDHIHKCGNQHYCNKECDYKKDSKPESCNNICCNSLPEHEGKHYCGNMHKCNHDCDYKGKSIACDREGKCILPYPHENCKHRCTMTHKCKEECIYKKDSRPGTCGEFCNETLNEDYSHEGIHICGKDHKCNHDCFYKDISRDCGGKCNLPFPHTEHNCLKTHKCKN